MHFSTTLVLSALAQTAFCLPGSHGGEWKAPSSSSNASLTPDISRWPEGIHLAVDYYPTQWPEYMWEEDIARMASNNISYVRVAEFDWAVLEPKEGQYNFTSQDCTLELLGKYGLKAIIGTPTASPPNWVVENYQVNFVDVTNTTLLFGSRRGYSFSSFDYRRLSQKITRKMAERYGNNTNVVGWQLDNEFGCHGTTRSYDHDAKVRFRTWLQAKYATIEDLNAAQGRVFWSSQYESFEAVEPPFLEVYMLNELHTLDWYEFSSDMVVEFAQEQAASLRDLAPRQFITTNFMVLFMDFDHYDFNRRVGLDLATYDQYALAGTGSVPLSEDEMADYLRTGVPDLQAMQHAIYRGVSGAAYGRSSGPHGVMEIEPGILNWNTYRVAPADGMVRVWTHETFAAYGDMVNYFRWRQVPYAQEQTLEALLLPDDMANQGLEEMQEFEEESLQTLRSHLKNDTNSHDQDQQADVAMVFDYRSNWVWSIEPYSGVWSVKDAGFTDTALAYTDVAYAFYTALRRLGLSIDIISPSQSLEGYQMVVVPSLPIIPDTFNEALTTFTGPVIFGPHTGDRTPEFAYTPGLAPSEGTVRDRLPMRVTRYETPPSYAQSGVEYNGAKYNISLWEESLTCSRGNASSQATITSTSRHRSGNPAACAEGDTHYLGFNPPVDLLVSYLGDVAGGIGLRDLAGREVRGEKNDLGATLRMMRRGDLLWAINYGLEAQAAPEVDGEVVVGKEEGDVPATGVKVWKLARSE
ncbi:glycoside hydrolase family 42 protein [Hortaea werneckii]|nr:glycoside hydrolase family 42 protein [Hortaea werneckii]